MDWVWDRLGIAPTEDVGEIRRAYAARLKAIDTETDPGAFIALRQARDEAMAHAAGEADRPFDFELDEDWPEPAFEEVPKARPTGGLAAGAEGHMDRIDALLFAGAEPEDPGELERLTRAVLDGMPDHIESARWLESWVAARIVHAMPRSDPMIDPAIAHFRWDRLPEISRDPDVDYILQRRDDRVFEIDLAANGREYALVLESLREPPGALRGRKGRWLAPRVEYLLSYLQTYRPTVLRSLDQENVRLWYGRIEADREGTGPGHWFRERRRKLVWGRGLHEVHAGREESGSLASGGWLIFVALFAASRLLTISSGSGTPQAVADAPPVAILFQDAEADLNPYIDRATLGRGDLAALQASNPWLHGQLMEKWRQGRREARDRAWLDEGVIAVLNEGFSDAVRGGSYEIQADHWRLLVDELKWARQTSPALCAAVLRSGVPDLALPLELDRRSKDLVARALLAPAGRPPKRKPAGTTYAIPRAVAELTRSRTRLDDEILAEALMDRGTPAQRCDARIALIEAALEQPRAVAAPLLRDMSSTL